MSSLPSPLAETTATIMALSDWPPKPVDTLLFFGRTKGDAETLFGLIAETITSGLATHVLINGAEDEEKCGHSKTTWTGRLNKLGVTSVHAFDPAFNTTEEAHQIVKYSQELGWRSAAIVAQPHQVLRCMTALIVAMRKAQYQMRIYTVTPRICNWLETTRGSGNQMPMDRLEHVREEYSRIQKYAAMGHTATPEDVIAYYRKRESL